MIRLAAAAVLAVISSAMEDAVLMAQKVVAVVVGVFGLWLNTWHGAVLPFNHFAVFGGGRDGFGAQHYLHSMIGLVLIALAIWLWLRASKAAKAPSTPAA